MHTIPFESTPSNFRDLLDIEPIGPHDQDCLDEIRAVLARHEKLDRFGLCLLHSHFDMASDEILLEESDSDGRCMTIRPAKVADIVPEDVVFTNWSLADGSALQAVQACTKKQHIAGNNVRTLQACNKKTHVGNHGYLQAIQACTKKQHVAGGGLLALQACTKKQHVTA